MKPDSDGAIAAARDLLEALGITDAPIDPFAIARALKIELQPARESGLDFSGCLMVEGGTWGILYRDDIPVEGFKRFTVAHEIGHYELSRHHDVIFSGGPRHFSESGFTSNMWYETEADSFAAELLQPRALFEAAIRDTTIGLPAIKDLAERFGTSLTSTAIRYAQHSPDPVAIVVSAEGRVRYAFTSLCMRKIRADWIERATPVPTASVTGRLFKGGPSAGTEHLGHSFLSAWFTNPARDLKFNEDVIELGRYGRTLTVLHATEIPDEEEIAELESEEAADSDCFNPDGKRIRWR